MAYDDYDPRAKACAHCNRTIMPGDESRCECCGDWIGTCGDRCPLADEAQPVAQPVFAWDETPEHDPEGCTCHECGPNR